MAATIQINDGNPWWVSTDIWVVPGNDPTGSVGVPIAGQPNYVWARVHNTGTTAADGILVQFYWSNPATGVLRSNSQLIGNGFVDLEPNEVKEVLCISPWNPIVVNGGHECLVVEAVTALDPLPSPLPDAFDPPTYHQIAQRNLQVISLSSKMRRLSIPIQLSATARKEKAILLTIDSPENGKELAAQWLRQAEQPALPYTEKLVRFSLKQTSGCDDGGIEKPVSRLKVNVPAGQATAVFIQLEINEGPKSGVQVLHIQELEGDKVIGGNSILVTYHS